MIIDYLNNNQIDFKKDVPTRSITHMTQNSTLPLIVYPAMTTQLEDVLLYCITNALSFDILGGLTNTYLCESYHREVVIITTKVCDLAANNNSCLVGCGYNLTAFARQCTAQGVAGFEGFIGIPGTIGGATINNSGAFTSSMHHVVKGIQMITPQGEKKILTNTELRFEKRSSIFKRKECEGYIVSIELDISKHADKDTLDKQMASIKESRKSSIDGSRKSLGSIFVSTTLKELYQRHKTAFFLKKIGNLPFRLLLPKKRKINTFLDFLFLGHPSLARHCDSLNRFCWDKETKEDDLLKYIQTMQHLSNQKLQLEIEIKK